jgi:predicted dehydrogenase
MIKVGVIGLGYWGPNLVRNFYKHPETAVKALCDLDEKRVARIKMQYKDIPVGTADYRELLKSDVELVAIATPPETHYKLAKEALLAEKHILVEKPFTKTSAEAEELINIAERKNLKIFVDHTFVFHPVVRKMREILSKGGLGEIYYFDSERVNLGLLQTGVNVVWDLAVHDFSIISYLFPDLNFVKVQTFGSKHIHPYYEDMAHIIL